MKKLNRKGYLTIEIIVASVITFIIAFFLIDLTMKLVDNTDNAYVDVLLITDKTLIINNIKKELEKDMLENGSIHKVVCDEDAKKCTITLNNGELRFLSVNDDNVIKYQKIPVEGETEDIYSKKIHNSLSDISISSSTDHGYYNFKISGENIFIDEDYEMNINVYNKSVPILVSNNDWFKSNNYKRSQINEIRFVDYIDEETNKNAKESWGAAEGLNATEITCYINEIDERLILTIAGNGTGKIYANPDSSRLFGGDERYDDCFTLIEKIENLKILDTSLTTTMLGMFGSCKKLTFDSFDISSFDTSNVKSIRGMFYNCESLEKINLSGFDTSNVENMISVFEKCINLEKIIFYEEGSTGNFDTSKVTNMSFLFHGCNNLTSVDLSVFNTTNVESMRYMFTGCSSLTNLNISNFNTTKVTDMSYMFSKCINLEEIKFFEDDSTIKFNTANVTNMFAMFYRCEKLKKLNLYFFDTSNVISMRSMFSGCSNLEELDISNFNTAKVLDMTAMFALSENLKIINISSFNPVCLKYIYAMFSGCPKLETVYVSKYWDENLNRENIIYKIGDKEYDNMVFSGSYVIVGGNGTKYNSDNLGDTYARIDGEEPGYFTKKTSNIDYSKENMSCPTDEYVPPKFEEDEEIEV